MNAEFDLVEGKIIERLKAEVKSFKTVEGYAGQIEGDITKLPVRFPAAFVVYSGSQFSLVDGPTHAETSAFAVLVCARNVRSASDSREAAYDLVKDVLLALTNQNFGLQMERLRPVNTTLVFTDKTITVYGIDFETAFDTQFNW